MTSKQGQTAADNSTALQAGRDAYYSAGISPEQMVEIFEAVQRSVSLYTEQSKSIIEERLEKFRNNLIKEFSETRSGKIEAFSDPDFQGALLDAQKAVARSGDESLENVLVGLVSKRSTCEKRDRLCLTLNDAISKVGSIPEPDLNTLSLIFIIKEVQQTGVFGIEGLSGFYSKIGAPLLSNISTSKSAINYLGAHNCIVPPSGIGDYKKMLGVLLERYGPLFSKGASEEDFRAEFVDYDNLSARGLIVDSPYGGGLKTFSINGDTLDAHLATYGLFGSYRERYSRLKGNARPSEEELKGVLGRYFFNLNQFVTVYDDPNIRNSSLTSIGIALAHANLSKWVMFPNVPLSVWIKP